MKSPNVNIQMRAYFPVVLFIILYKVVQNFKSVNEIVECENSDECYQPGGGGGVLGLMFAGYVPLASQSPYPILVYFLANYRPHLIPRSHQSLNMFKSCFDKLVLLNYPFTPWARVTKHV